MTSAQPHVIRRQVLEVDIVGTEADGLALQRILPGVCQDWLMPALEDVLDRSVPSDEHWIIDRLDIDAGRLRPEDLQRGLIDAVTQAIERYLREQAPRTGSISPTDHMQRRRQAQFASDGIQPWLDERTSPGFAGPSSSLIERATQAQSLHEAFLYFLETGVLPWWFSLPPGKTLEDRIRETWQSTQLADTQPEHFARALAHALGSTSTRVRLVRQFTENFLETLLAGLAQDGPAAVKQVLVELGKQDIAAQTLKSFFEHVWETAFAMAVAGERMVLERLVSRSLRAMSVGAQQQDLLLVERIARLWPGAIGSEIDESKTAPRERDEQLITSDSPPDREHPGEQASRIDLGKGVYEAWAAAIREVVAELGKYDIAAQSHDSFSQRLWEAAFTLALAGQSPAKNTLIAASFKATSSSGAPHDPLLVERIRQLWPNLSGIDDQIQGQMQEDALRERDAPDRPSSAAQKPVRNFKKPAEFASRIDLKEGVYIPCAGIVLLHPFLPRFFEALGIAKEDKLLQPERALSLLHFLATGQRVAPEYDLLLPKLLCNLPLGAPVESRIELTAAEEEEAGALLAAVIRHWDALGDTSADGLRGSFLVRPGKLSQRGGDNVLQVETRSYDILLDRLPWGIGLIQLPWMEKILWVEWRF